MKKKIRIFDLKFDKKYKKSFYLVRVRFWMKVFSLIILMLENLKKKLNRVW